MPKRRRAPLPNRRRDRLKRSREAHDWATRWLTTAPQRTTLTPPQRRGTPPRGGRSAEANPQLDRPALPPGERDREDARALLARYERLVDRALERMESWSDAEWRRVGTQLPDPQVNRTVPQPTNVAGQALRIVEHSGTHLRQLRDNLAADQAWSR